MMGSGVIEITTFLRQDAENGAEASTSIAISRAAAGSVSAYFAYAELMKALKPIFLVLAGVTIIFVGLVYHTFFGGIPYQDPSPEVYANWLLHSRIGSYVILAGIVIFLVGMIWGIGRMLWRLVRAS